MTTCWGRFRGWRRAGRIRMTMLRRRLLCWQPCFVVGEGLLQCISQLKCNTVAVHVSNIFEELEALWGPDRWIVPSVAPWRTAEQAPRRHDGAFGHAVPRVRIDGVRAARRLKAARRLHQRRDSRLVKLQHGKRNLDGQCLALVVEFIHLRGAVRAPVDRFPACAALFRRLYRLYRLCRGGLVAAAPYGDRDQASALGGRRRHAFQTGERRGRRSSPSRARRCPYFMAGL
mmetsp:Transcript_9681/g.26303  ORF Transcript_9681/g.26303 Transcript_9681/m.26303 type:complete len:230 (-) Transcript_9681:147-836(-)